MSACSTDGDSATKGEISVIRGYGGDNKSEEYGFDNAISKIERDKGVLNAVNIVAHSNKVGKLGDAGTTEKAETDAKDNENRHKHNQGANFRQYEVISGVYAHYFHSIYLL